MTTPTDTPRASVVVATYNRPAMLVRLLRSLAEQDTDDFEVIAVDDGSTPPTQVDETFPFPFRLIRRVNGGAGAARDTGIREAQGEVVIITDDDMIANPRFVSAHLTRFDDGCDVVIGRFLLPEDDHVMSFHMGLMDAYFDACEQSDANIEPGRLCTGNVSFRRALYDEVGGFDLTLKRCEDKELGLRFAGTGATFGFAHGGELRHEEGMGQLGDLMTVGYEYGVADVAIGNRHPELPSASPWFVLAGIQPLVRLPMRALMRVPWLMRPLATGVGAVGKAAVKLRINRLAGPLFGLGYALQYFAGAVHATGGAAATRRAIAEYEAAAAA